MDTKARTLLLKIVSIALIACVPMASADAVSKPKAAGRTAASIPNTILSGVGAPSSAVGIDGDFYIDTKNLNIYGPKMKKKWPKAVSLKGSNGSNGTDGKSGNDGKTITNASTVAGPSGVQGFPGLPGTQGDIGPKGEQGLRGEVGATGTQGIVGPIGVQGPIGLTGVTGSQGPAGSGSQGVPGATGATGAQGPIGLTGVTGSQGPAGSGSQGLPGATGATGAQGPGGATGSQGPSGSGATGGQGPAGATGASGANGNVGATGPEGPTGPTGLTGAQGASGAAGGTGGTGLTGNVGATGTTGAQGVQGENGFSQVTWVPILTWNLNTDVPGQHSDSLTFASLAVGKTYYVNISVHGESTKISGSFTGELFPSSTPAFFVMDQSVSEANVYSGIGSKHIYSFNLHGVITVGASVTSFTFRVSDGAGVTTDYPMTLIGKATFIMVGSIG
jgi:hypothetical protein